MKIQKNKDRYQINPKTHNLAKDKSAIIETRSRSAVNLIEKANQTIIQIINK